MLGNGQEGAQKYFLIIALYFKIISSVTTFCLSNECDILTKRAWFLYLKIFNLNYFKIEKYLNIKLNYYSGQDKFLKISRIYCRLSLPD